MEKEPIIVMDDFWTAKSACVTLETVIQVKKEFYEKKLKMTGSAEPEWEDYGLIMAELGRRRRAGCASKVILHLCADIGSDSYPYYCDTDYNVIRIGKDIGVQRVTAEWLEECMGITSVCGVIANPVCTDLSRARRGGKPKDIESGMFLVQHCLRIINEVKPKWWCLENPASSALRQRLGEPKLVYQPWEYGSPWTKKTALWGEFNIPVKKYTSWKDVPNKIPELYIRTKRGDTKPALPFQHKSALKYIKEFYPFAPFIKTDADLRSLCSQHFAQAYYEANK